MSQMCNETFLSNILTYLITPFSVCFYVFILKAIIQTQWDDVSDVCEKSNLWYYLTTIFIISVMNPNDLIEKDKNLYVCFLILIFLGLFIWGAYELFGIGCVDNLESTLLYKLSLTYWIFSCVCIGFLILSACFGFCTGVLKLVFKTNDQTANLNGTGHFSYKLNENTGNLSYKLNATTGNFSYNLNL